MTADDIRLGIEIATAVGLVFAVGRAAGRVEQAVKKIEHIESRLDRIPAIEQHLEFIDARSSRIESHHRELAEKTAQMRGELTSIHET